MRIKKNNFGEWFNVSRLIHDTTLKKRRPTLIVFFRPDKYMKSLASIGIESLAQLGFKWVIINTNLKNKKHPRIKQLKAWIKEAHEHGLKILVLTNRPKRLIEKNLKLLDLKYDQYLSGVLKPFIIKRKKLFKIVGNLEQVYMICNDFLVDVPTANILRIENTVIEDNFLYERLIDRKVANYQKNIVIYFLKRNNMFNELQTFEVNASISNEFL